MEIRYSMVKAMRDVYFAHRPEEVGTDKLTRELAAEMLQAALDAGQHDQENTMSKTQEQRIRAAAKGVKALNPAGSDQWCERVARAALEAADREPPKWPTSETMHLLYGAGHWDEQRRDMALAGLLADPIIKAAIAMREHARTHDRPIYGAVALFDAIDEAGL